MSQSDTSDSEEDSINLSQINSVIKNSIVDVSDIIRDLKKIQTKLSYLEQKETPLQVGLYSGDFKIRSDSPELELVAGKVYTYKHIIQQIMRWIDRDHMEKGGYIFPSASFATVFGLKEGEGITFPVILGRLKRIVF
jgi:hypothetical protein